jgi:hypothetical protein
MNGDDGKFVHVSGDRTMGYFSIGDVVVDENYENMF